jgi:G-protein signaling modulator 2
MQNKQSEVLQKLSAVTAASGGEEQLPDDTFFETLMKCQGSRIEEQRSALPNNRPAPAPTVPDEDFFSLIHKLQGNR